MEKVCKKDLHKGLSEAFKSEHERNLCNFKVEDVLEFLDDQVKWKMTEELSDITNKDDSRKKRDDIELGSPEGKKKEDSEKRDKVPIGIQFDYSKLIGKSTKESRPIKILIDRIHDGKKILKHPLIEAFVLMKWLKLAYFWYLWVFFKIVFMFLFFNYGSLTVEYLGMKQERYNCSDIVTREDPQDQIVKTSRRDEADFSKPIEIAQGYARKYSIYAIWGGFVLFEFVEILKIIYQRLIHRTRTRSDLILSIKRYSSIRNVLQLVIYFCLTLPLLFFKLECQTKNTLHSFLLPIMAIEILFEFGYHPYLYQYIYMFYRVIKSYFLILCIYMPIIYGFCCSFYQMFPETDDFAIEKKNGTSKMLGKTFAMLLGEIDYMDIPIQNNEWRMLLTLAFLFSMPLALLNILNAVAIVDIKEMIKEAETEVLYNLLILLEIVEPVPFREVIIIFYYLFIFLYF